MQDREALRTLLAQARLHVRRAQYSMGHNVELALDECAKACCLLDRVMGTLTDKAQEDEVS